LRLYPHVMQLSCYPYQLKFKYPFRIAHGLRETTDLVYVKLQHENFVAWGEAALPPYLPETQQSVINFLTDFATIVSPQQLDDWFEKLAEDKSSNLAAKAALDMALWDMKAQIENTTVSKLLGIERGEYPLCTYTIGVCSFEEMSQKIDDANDAGFELFKLKLNGKDDESIIHNFKRLSQKPFMVDVNQGWNTAEEAIEKIHRLIQEKCAAVEQPLKKEMLQEMKLVKKECATILFADESCQRLGDVERLADSFSGINIKLMKCGSLTEAVNMIKKARQLNLKVLIGCMSESSVGCSAAAILSPLADYADLDGPYLIANDPFDGMKVREGRIAPNPLVQKIPV
jgi:L-alanine-DL-glutamate epimerase-like enolase superfamily enzyme